MLQIRSESDFSSCFFEKKNTISLYFGCTVDTTFLTTTSGNYLFKSTHFSGVTNYYGILTRVQTQRENIQ